MVLNALFTEMCLQPSVIIETGYVKFQGERIFG
jgi:hypothetical protein